MNIFTVAYYDLEQQGCNSEVQDIVEVLGVAYDAKGVLDIIKKNEGGSFNNVHLVNQETEGSELLDTTAKKQTVWAFEDEEAQDDCDAMGAYIVQRIKLTPQRKQK